MNLLSIVIIHFRKSDKVLLCLNTGRKKNPVLIVANLFSVLWNNNKNKKVHGKTDISNGSLAIGASSLLCFPMLL